MFFSDGGNVMPGYSGVVPELSLYIISRYLLPWPKKEPSSSFAARRTLFHV